MVDADGVIARIQRQQIAQRCGRAFIYQVRILLIVVVFTALNRLLQRADYVRVVGVIFTAVNIFQQTALIQRLTDQPGAFRQIQQILLEVIKARAADAADNAEEAQVGNLTMQANRFEQLRAAVGGDGRDAHLRHDLVQAFVDAVTVVQHHGTIIFLNGLVINQFRQRLIGQVRIDSRGAEAQQHREMVRVTGAGGLNDNVGIAAQALIHQAGLNRAYRHRCRNRQTIFGDITIGEHQQNGTVTDHLFRFIAQRLHRFGQRGFRGVKGDIQGIGAIVLLFHGGELFEIGVQQDR